MSGVTDDLDLFACALRGSRYFRGWTNKEVGERAKMDQNEIALIQRGERLPTLPTMVRICRQAFDMSLIDFLLIGDRQQKKTPDAEEGG